jgi:hypothetical protein
MGTSVRARRGLHMPWFKFIWLQYEWSIENVQHTLNHDGILVLLIPSLSPLCFRSLSACSHDQRLGGNGCFCDRVLSGFVANLVITSSSYLSGLKYIM